MREDSKERLNDMKNEYDRIPVPEEARRRMEAGIAAARKEKKSATIVHFARNTGATAAAAMLMLGVVVNTNPGIANAMEDIPIIGTLARVVTFKTYEDLTNGFEADIKVPQVTLEGQKEGELVAANKSIEEYGEQLVKQYEADLAASQGEGHYSLTSDYEVVTDSSRYLCIRVNTTLIMASGTEFVKIFTIDKTTGETVSLNQLFHNDPDYKKKISANIIEQMEAQMAADENVKYFHGAEDVGEEYNFKEITGEESFYFNKDGQLVIAFDEYDVAPGYMGAVEFAIPKSVTGELIG